MKEVKEANERKIKSSHKRKDLVGLFVCTIVGILMFVVVMFSLNDNTQSNNSSFEDYTVIELQSEDVTSNENIMSTEQNTSYDYSKEDAEYDSYHIKSSDVYKGDLIIVNNSNPYLFTDDCPLLKVYENKVQEYSLGTGEERLFEKTIQNANKFFVDFYNVSSLSNVLMYNCFLTKEEQQKKYDSYMDSASEEEKQYAVKAGGSDAHTGLSFKLRLYPANGKIGEGEYAWLTENAFRYGFIMRYPEDKVEITGVKDINRFRYVGIPHASYMYENNLCLEEYISALKETDFSDPLEHIYDGTLYKIYYVKAESYSETTEIKIPEGFSYTYSGDNSGGFVVTAFEQQK